MFLFWLLLMCFAWQVPPLHCLVHAGPAMLPVPQWDTSACVALWEVPEFD
jgi:hypothetical protein